MSCDAGLGWATHIVAVVRGSQCRHHVFDNEEKAKFNHRSQVVVLKQWLQLHPAVSGMMAIVSHEFEADELQKARSIVAQQKNAAPTITLPGR